MNERDLIARSLKGDEGAFGILVEQNRGAVYRHCLSVVHDEEIAEDLTQEAFLHAFQHLNHFRMDSLFSTWLWRIAHNLSLSYLKKKRGHIEQEFKEEFLPPELFETEQGNDELISRIREAMSHLSPKHREVIEMYDLKHIPQKQIAVELGIPSGTVRSRLHYAREKIRQFLREA